jgi:hypothetical protein
MSIILNFSTENEKVNRQIVVINEGFSMCAYLTESEMIRYDVIIVISTNTKAIRSNVFQQCQCKFNQLRYVHY